MKKIKTLLAFTFVVLLGLTACQQSVEREAQNVADKINNKEALTEDDYTLMIKYVGEYAEKAQPIVVNENGQQMQGQLDAIKQEYPLADIFRNCIKSTPIDKFNKDNLDLLQKYGGLVEFTMPEGMTLQTDPQAAGIEMATPPAGDNNGVVAGGVDEVKVEKK